MPPEEHDAPPARALESDSSIQKNGLLPHFIGRNLNINVPSGSILIRLHYPHLIHRIVPCFVDPHDGVAVSKMINR